MYTKFCLSSIQTEFCIYRLFDFLLKIYYDWMTVNNRHFPLFAVDARQKDDVLLMIEALIASLEVQSVTTEIE